MKYFLLIALIVQTVGSVESRAQDARPHKPVESLAPSEGGSNTGGGIDPNAKLLMEWCTGRVGILNHYKGMAQLRLVSGEYEAAFQQLKQGIEEALKKEGVNSDKTILHKALVRGLEISARVQEIVQKNKASLRKDEAYLVLAKYYDFLITKAADFDREFYVHQRLFAAGASSEEVLQRNHKEFEQRFVVYSKEQLRFVNDGFANYSREQGATPNGHSKIYLTLAELITSYVMEDLLDPNNLFYLKFACVVEHLDLLHKTLATFNLGDRNKFSDARQAVNYTFAVINSFNGEIMIQNVPTGCWFR